MTLAFNQFVDNIGQNKNSDQHESIQSIKLVLEEIKGLEVSYEWYLKNKGEGNFQQLLEQQASSSTQHGRVWSKLNVRRSKKETEKTGGIILESTVGGSILNGLLFGFDWGESSAIGEIWDMMSTSYVSGLSNVVEADVLEGIDPTSVLSITEIDKLLELVKIGTVKKLVVNIYKMKNNTFAKVNEIEINNREAWDAIEKFPNEEVNKSVNPSMISDLPAKERQRMIDKTERMFDELETKLRTIQKEIPEGNTLAETSEKK